jgi:hypothetical protein
MAEDQKLARKTIFDLTRQALTIAPIIFFFLTSKNVGYISLTLFTSATTVASAILLMGLNVVLLLPRNKSLLVPIIRYGFLATLVCTFAIFFVSSMLNIFPKVDSGSLLMFIAAEATYGIVLLMLGRYSISQNLFQFSVLTNVLSPLARAIAILGFLTPGLSLSSALLYFSFNLILALLISKRLGVFQHYVRKGEVLSLRLLGEGIPIWLSSLGVTLIDNLSVFLIVNALGPNDSPDLLFALRVFATLSIPVQSVAAARLTKVTQSEATEARTAIISGLFTSLFGVCSIACFDYLSRGSVGSLGSTGISLFLYPVFRTFSTFMGNYLTYLNDRMSRAWIVAASLLVFIVSFRIFDYSVSQNMNVGSIVYIILGTELFMALLTFFRIHFTRRRFP